ncbi:2505_t:CDS:1, partial [Entrophospora sp. SA101]
MTISNNSTRNRPGKIKHCMVSLNKGNGKFPGKDDAYCNDISSRGSPHLMEE